MFNSYLKLPEGKGGFEAKLMESGKIEDFEALPASTATRGNKSPQSFVPRCAKQHQATHAFQFLWNLKVLVPFNSRLPSGCPRLWNPTSSRTALWSVHWPWAMNGRRLCTIWPPCAPQRYFPTDSRQTCEYTKITKAQRTRGILWSKDCPIIWMIL